MMEQLRLMALMLAAGVGIPVLAALNARLGIGLGSPVTAAAVLFSVALAASAGLMLAMDGTARLAGFASQPKVLFLAGLLVAFYVLSVTWAAPRLGLGTAILFVLMGQMISAALIDHFGLIGAKLHLLSPQRMLGLLLMAGGIVLAVRG